MVFEVGGILAYIPVSYGRNCKKARNRGLTIPVGCRRRRRDARDSLFIEGSQNEDGYSTVFYRWDGIAPVKKTSCPLSKTGVMQVMSGK
jgi:hypothetical protein